MVIRHAIGALAVLPVLVGPADAQQRVAVPEGAAIVVPARGAVTQAPRPAPPRSRPARLAPPSPEPAPGIPPAAALVPLAAAAVLAATLSGGSQGGGVSAPVRTR